MSLRFGTFYEGGRYHVYNRSVEGIEIFRDWRDLERFCDLLELVTTEERIVSVQATKKGDTEGKLEQVKKAQKLVTIEAFAVLPNHYHLLLKQEVDNGVARFMQKLGAGYSLYFNKRYTRSGTLWMGPYKYTEIENESDYLRIGSYVSRNHEIHRFVDTVSPRRTNSSYTAMTGNIQYPFCEHQYLLDSFGGVDAYQNVSKRIIEEILRMRGKSINEEYDLFLED